MQNISFLAEYERTARKYADFRLTVDYSPDETDRVTFSTIVENNSERAMNNYTYGLFANHPKTNLDLNGSGGLYWLTRWYRTHHITYYKRSYLPRQSSEALGMVDFRNNEIEFKVSAGSFSFKIATTHFENVIKRLSSTCWKVQGYRELK